MNTQTKLVPAAWLGLAADFHDYATVRICCRCPDRAQAEARAKADGYLTTHGYCQSCFEATMADIAENCGGRK